MGMVLDLIRIDKVKLESFLSNSELLEQTVFNSNNFDADWYLGLDKTWEGIQYLVSGKTCMELSPPLSSIEKALFTFQYVDEEQDLGYGPAQYLTPDQVKETSLALSSKSIEEYENRFNPKELDTKGVYPGSWSHSKAKEYVVDSLKELIKFYSLAAENNEAVITFMT